MFKWLAGSYPDLFAKLDVSATQVYALDCTYSSRTAGRTHGAPGHSGADQRQQRPHQESRRQLSDVRLLGSERVPSEAPEAYLKHTEFQAQLDELKRAGRADLSAARSASGHV
ncbi:hypothetical protein AB2C47_33055 [Pseudomonas aeruginosa]